MGVAMGIWTNYSVEAGIVDTAWFKALRRKRLPRKWPETVDAAKGARQPLDSRWRSPSQGLVVSARG